MVRAQNVGFEAHTINTLTENIRIEEILHQLIGGKHPIIYRVSTIRLVMQDFATIQSISRVKLDSIHVQTTNIYSCHEIQ